MRAQELRARAAALRGAVGVRAQYPQLFAPALERAREALRRGEASLRRMEAPLGGDSALAQDGAWARAAARSASIAAYRAAVEELRAAIAAAVDPA